MGMSEKEFRLTTPRYFHFRQKGFEANNWEQWRIARTVAFYAFLPHTKKGAIKNPEGLFRLPDEQRLPHLTEEFKAEAARVLEIAKTIDFFAGETMPQA